VRRDWRARQGVTTQWACAHKAEQRSMARRAQYKRVHSAVTYLVNVIKAEKVNVHTVFLKFESGQLPFPGLKVR
jgi:AmiR/NasT family two-component response regulator